MYLASVERIVKITPIEGADSIETCTVKGWEVVIKKGEFNVGDLITYIGIDTIVPDKIEYEFLRERQFRVRTIKLRKQISQGLVIPLPAGKWKEGADLTDLLGIVKYCKDVEIMEIYVPPMPTTWVKKQIHIFKYRYFYNWFPSLRPLGKLPFPSHLVSKTDEERIQNIPGVLNSCDSGLFVVTEKCDGSSITLIHELDKKGKSKFRVCSRNQELVNTSNDFHRVFESTNFSEHILSLVAHFKTDNIIVQGEYIGKPQKNYYQLKMNEIRLFNIFVNGKRLSQDVFNRTCVDLDIPSCPVISVMTLKMNLQEILAYAEGKSLINKTKEREGLVFRAVGSTLSFKVISNKFLLKNNE